MQITGTIVRLFQAQQISEKFKSQKVWIKETTGDYPNTFEVEFTNNNCAKLDVFAEGQEVVIDINLRGRYWQKDTREGVVTSLNGWKIALVEAGEVSPSDDDLVF